MPRPLYRPNQDQITVPLGCRSSGNLCISLTRGRGKQRTFPHAVQAWRHSHSLAFFLFWTSQNLRAISCARFPDTMSKCDVSMRAVVQSFFFCGGDCLIPSESSHDSTGAVSRKHKVDSVAVSLCVCRIWFYAFLVDVLADRDMYVSV